jgi:hypothetical protein
MLVRTLVSTGVLLAATLLGARIAVRASEPCGQDEICGLKNPEDMIRVGGTRWVLVSRLARVPQAPGGFSLVDWKHELHVC